MKTWMNAIGQKRRAAPKSFALLISLLLSSAGGFLLAFFYGQQHFFRFPPCFFYQVLGIWCLSCGSTRAAEALSRLHIAKSLALNPLPALLAAFALSLILHCIRNLLCGEDRRYRYSFVWLYGILAVLILFCILRNTGIL